MEESRLRKLKDEEDWTAFENGDAVATDSGKPAAAPAAGAEGQSDNSVSPSHATSQCDNSVSPSHPRYFFV